MNGCDTKERWYKFNDIIVEEFDMNEDTLEAECFGGTYKANVYDTGMSVEMWPFSDSLNNWLPRRLIYSLTDWLADYLLDFLADWLSSWLAD